MDNHEQQPHLNYQHHARQPANPSPPPWPTILQQEESSLGTLTISPIHISNLSTRPRKYKKAIIHDISTLTRKRRVSIQKSQPQIPNQSYATREDRNLRHKPVLTLEVLPTPREQLQLIRSQLKNSQQQEDDYLKHNLGTVKQKIRSKFLRHHVDFAEKEPSKKKHHKKLQTEPTENSIHKNITPKQRIDRYNHEFEEYLIRRRISKKKSYTLAPPDSRAIHPTCRDQNSPLRIEENMHNSLNIDSSDQQHLLRPPSRSPLYCGSDNNEAARLIIVSPLNPTHQIARFRNALIDSTRQSYPNNDQHSLLHRFLNRHLPHPSCSQTQQDNKDNTPIRSSIKNHRHQSTPTPTPANFIKSPLNYSLLKRQIHKVRKESIGLPHLLQGQQQYYNQALLEQKLNEKKISPHLTISPKTPPKKYVVYSRKNLFAAVSSPTNPFSEEEPEQL